MQSHILRRAAIALATLTAELYEDGKQFALEHGGPNPFLLRAGGELLRSPWREPYYLDPLLHEIREFMSGKEEVYGLVQDILDLMSLQFNPLTPQEQLQISQSMTQWLGVLVPPHAIIDMHPQEYAEAITRLTDFVAVEDLDAAMMQYVERHIPLVLRTVYSEQDVPDRTGRKRLTIPVMLPPQRFVIWFQHRLLLAVTTRLERFPDNQVWVRPDGLIQGPPTVRESDWADFDALLQAICRPVRPGRPRNPAYFTSAEDFQAQIIRVIRRLLQEGRRPTQEAVAGYFGFITSDRQIRTWLRQFHLRWDELVRRARQ